MAYIKPYGPSEIIPLFQSRLAKTKAYIGDTSATNWNFPSFKAFQSKEIQFFFWLTLCNWGNWTPVPCFPQWDCCSPPTKWSWLISSMKKQHYSKLFRKWLPKTNRTAEPAILLGSSPVSTLSLIAPAAPKHHPQIHNETWNVGPPPKKVPFCQQPRVWKISSTPWYFGHSEALIAPHSEGDYIHHLCFHSLTEIQRLVKC